MSALHASPNTHHPVAVDADLSGTWKNELGSKMTILVQDGRLSGTYHTGVGNVSENEAFDIVGFASGGLVGFSVYFGEGKALTSWTGHAVIIDGGVVISTMWHLGRALANPDDPSLLWSSMLVGWDVFLPYHGPA